MFATLIKGILKSPLKHLTKMVLKSTLTQMFKKIIDKFI
jgi:hypothetical protein